MAKVTHDRRKAAGLCVRCGTCSPRVGKLLCEDCAAAEKIRVDAAGYNRNQVRKKKSPTKDNRKAAGLCILCGKVPPEEGKIQCKNCNKKMQSDARQRERANRKNGFCRCGGELVPGFKNCQECVDRQRRRDDERKKAGLCTFCSGPAAPNRTRCVRHLLEMRIRNLDVLSEEKPKVRAALESFNGICQNPGCGATHPGTKRHDWNVDHDHATGKFRGILCMHCNSLLGYAKDNPRVLAGAIAYLERFLK